jgi:hypothetical protein
MSQTTVTPADGQQVRSRRQMLRLAGAAAAGAVAAGTVAGSAEAADNDNMIIGQLNLGSQPTSLLGSTFTATATSAASYALGGSNLSTNVASLGIQGVTARGAGVQGLSTQGDSVAAITDGTGVHGQGKAYGLVGYSQDGIGVRGHSNSAAGVDARSDTYIDLRCVGTGRMWLADHVVDGPPTGVGYFSGEIVRDGGGAFFACVNGNGGAGVWRVLASQFSAGSLHILPAPARVYDSRRDMTPMSNGVISTGSSRTISVADRRNPTTGAVTGPNVVPAGATAVAFNLTAVSTVGTNGFLAVNPGTDTTVYASHINWTANGLSIANAGVAGISGRQMTVICGGTSTSAHFIIDVTGYYL